MLKRHEVEILLKAGHPKSEVAGLAGVSLCSVKRIAESPHNQFFCEMAQVLENKWSRRPELKRRPTDYESVEDNPRNFSSFSENK